MSGFDRNSFALWPWQKPRWTVSASLLAGALFLVGVAVFAWPKLFKPVTEELPLPPTGEAAYNPLYALKLALKQQSLPVSTWPNLASAQNALGAHDTLLLLDQPEALRPAQAERLLAWVRGGGHLLVPGPDEGEDPGALARLLGLKAFEAPPAPADAKKDEDDDDFTPCPELRMPGAQPIATAPAKTLFGAGPASTPLCDPPFVANLPGFVLAGGDAEHGWRFARRELGEGLVTVTELDYLDNEHLRRPEAQAMAWQLLSPRLHAGRIHLVYSADVPNLLRLLLMYASPVLLPLLLALFAWLAWRGLRFGPLQPVAAPRRRALLEHVHSAGEFAWSRNRAGALHAAVLRLFHRRLQLREPMIFALAEDAQALALAERFALPASRVRQALRPQGLHHPGTFTQAIATLLQMRVKL